MPKPNADRLHTLLNNVRTSKDFGLYCCFEAYRESPERCRVVISRPDICIGTATTAEALKFFETRIADLSDPQFLVLMHRLGMMTEHAAKTYKLAYRKLYTRRVLSCGYHSVAASDHATSTVQ